MRKRNIHIGICVSPEEHEALKARVREAGMTQREYLLRCALGKEIVNTDGLRELIPEMKRQGNNLNQIAKHLNTMGQVGEVAFASCMEEVAKTWQSLRRRLRTLR